MNEAQPSQDSISPPTPDTERALFNIARFILILCSLLGFFAAVWFLWKAGEGLLVQADKEMHLNEPAHAPDTKVKSPELTLDDFQKQEADKKKVDSIKNTSGAAKQLDTGAAKRELDKDVERAAQEAKEAKTNLETQKRFAEYAKVIIDNLVRYSEIVKQAHPEELTVKAFLEKSFNEVTEFLNECRKSLNCDPEGKVRWDFLEGLKAGTAKLVELASTVDNGGSAPPVMVKWDDFISWFIETYKSKLEAEKDRAENAQAEYETKCAREKANEMARITREQLAVAAARAESVIALSFAGIALGGFVLATILLGLLRIEVATRILRKIEVNTRKG